MNETKTQIAAAKAGVITPAMKRVADIERLSPEAVRDEVACGRMVIPANPRHARLLATGIGIAATCKVNANIGRSPERSDEAGELDKLRLCVQYGADTVMDLSVGGRLNEMRGRIIAESPLPVGTVPLYQAADAVEDVTTLAEDDFLEVIRTQAEEGVDFMTVHCGLLSTMLPLAANRMMGIVSRGGALMARWMAHHRRENPLYTRFDDILAICRAHDVTLSLGDGLRPGCLADASDEAQFAELDVLGELTLRCREADVQVMIEGPGHVPFDQIAMNVEREQRVCREAPFYVLGPVVTDIAPGYDHITSAIGATAAAYAGAALLCYVTPKEHLGLPGPEDVRAGIIAYKIAAHAADVARRRPGARDRDDAMACARFNFEWDNQFKLSLDPQRAIEYFCASNPDLTPEQRDHCSMCGAKLCAIKSSRALGGRGSGGGA
ncbi:phosphomethylpyrimidine synthase ThiC [bacterium]|nr:phosphomethylpyrimidine synthase ThiC [bacterium]